MSRCALHVLAIGAALVLLLPVRLGAESCTGELRIDQRSFRRLDVKHQILRVGRRHSVEGLRRARAV